MLSVVEAPNFSLFPCSLLLSTFFLSLFGIFCPKLAIKTPKLILVQNAISLNFCEWHAIFSVRHSIWQWLGIINHKKLKKMKKSIIFLTALFALALNFSLNAQTASSSANATASANIVTPLSIWKNSDLAFGNIAAGQSWGSVTVDYYGSRYANGGVTLINAGSYSSSAQFSISGYPYATFAISLPYSIMITNGSSWMQVDNFNSDLGWGSTLDWYGNAWMNIGATLEVNPGQEPGMYTGSFDVTVNYN
jgi:hypothetical protein